MDSYSEPPPPYREDERKQPQCDQGTNQFRIARKPVSAPITNPAPVKDRFQQGQINQDLVDNVDTGLRKLDLEDEVPDLPLRPGLSLDTSVPASITSSELYLSPEQTRTGTTASSASTIGSSFSKTSSTPSTAPSSANSSLSSTSYAQKAFREARHFAGGLIQRPYESTKHFTILRHSHGLVFYQGRDTTLAVSIFSDAPLPTDRTLWLQSKGWTGKTGMRAKAFMGRNSNWLNVTPSMKIEAEQLKPDNERAWQRDFAKFRKNADRHIRDHVLQETAIVRIPAEAGDGYFQLVLCLGEKEKVLCPSPVFRVLSTSASPHSIRGASLSTLPLELGAMVLGMYTRSTVGNAVAPVTAAVQSQVRGYMPSWSAREAVSTAYSVSGVSNKVSSTIGDANNRYDQVRDGSYATIGEEQLWLEQGPKAPYPVHFVGRCEPDANENVEFTLPNISVTKVPDHVAQKLHGYYFGWARFVEKGNKTITIAGEDTWHQAVISVLTLNASQLARATIAEASKKNISVRLICDFDNTPPDQMSIEIQVMGFLRPDEPSQRATLEKGLQDGDEAAAEAAVLSEVDDVSMAQSILDHPSWNPEATLEKSEQRPSGLERVKTGYANTRMAAQRQMDRVPLHKFGVRIPTDQMKDKAIVTNGFYVVR